MALGRASHKLAREGRKHGLKWQNYQKQNRKIERECEHLRNLAHFAIHIITLTTNMKVQIWDGNLFKICNSLKVAYSLSKICTFSYTILNIPRSLISWATLEFLVQTIYKRLVTAWYLLKLPVIQLIKMRMSICNCELIFLFYFLINIFLPHNEKIIVNFANGKETEMRTSAFFKETFFCLSVSIKSHFFAFILIETTFRIPFAIKMSESNTLLYSILSMPSWMSSFGLEK